MVRNSKKGEPDVLKLPGLFRWLISRMIDELNYLPPIGVCRGFCCCAEMKVISVHVSVEKEFPYEDFSEVWTFGRMARDKHTTRRRTSSREWFLLVLAALATFWLLGVFHDKGISPKWVTAIMGTLFPFGVVIYGHRHWLTRWTFWIALLVCLVVHCILILAIFQYVLKSFTHFSPLLWAPIMTVEFLALLVVIAKIENALGGNRDRKTIRISF